MSKQSKTSFNKMTVFTLSDAVLLGGMWAGHTVRYTIALKILMKLMIFTTPVRLDGFKFGVRSGEARHEPGKHKTPAQHQICV
jgi:hypothetical protein